MQRLRYLKRFEGCKNTSKIWAPQNRICIWWIERH